MKNKVIPIIALLFFVSPSLFSQGFKFGIKGGANLGKISGQTFKDEFTLGYHVGVFATIGGKHWGIQPEVLLSQVNADTSTRFSDVYAFNHINKIQLKALTIPILFNYNLNKVITLQAGPQFGVILDQNKDLLQNGKDAFKSGNFSLAAGVQLNILKLRVYGRFVGGLTDLKDIDAADTWKAQTIQLGVGLVL
ncbi:MAG: porin family protein [Ginsengibacter sp.]